MIRSLGTEPFKYVLEAERSLPDDEQTVFFLIARTVEQVNADTTASMRSVFEKNRKGVTDSDEKAGEKLASKEAKIFGQVVAKVKNVCVRRDAPRDFFNKYREKFDATEDSKEIVIKETDERAVIEDLFYVLASDVTTEVRNAANKNDRLSDEEKN